MAITSQPVTESAGAVVTQGSTTGILQTTLTGTGMTNVVIEAASGVVFLDNVDLVIGNDEWTMAINSQFVTENAGVIVTQNEWTLGITSQAICENAGVTVTQGSVTGILKATLQNAWTLAITAQTITENAGVTVTQGSVTGILETALSNEWTMAITAQAITENAGVTVTQGSVVGTLKTALQNEWTMAITSQDITEEIGVAVTQKEWTLSITSQSITQSAGVTVTQGSVTGTLKTALTGDSTSVVISTAADVVFVATTDVVIGSTTVVLANIATATNSLSAVGTLKTALTGAGMTDVVINTASGVSFVITSDLIIGSSTVLLANANTATNNGATTNIIIATASGINFLTSADIVVGTTTVVHANVNTATNNGATTSVIINTAPGITFVTTSDVVIGSTTVALANVNTATNTGLTTNVVITTVPGISFVTTADVVIGFTTVVLSNVNTASNNIAVSGTLKTTLVGTTTSLVLESVLGITFVNTADLMIGSTKILYNNINTATKTKSPSTIVHSTISSATNSGASTNVLLQTISGGEFVTTADLLIGSTTVLLANVNSVANNGATTTVQITSDVGQVFDTTTNLIVNAATVLHANVLSTSSTTTLQKPYDSLHNWTSIQCSTAKSLYNRPEHPELSKTGSWGADVYYHTNGYRNEILPLEMLNSWTWERPNNEGVFAPKQHDLTFDVDVSPALEEGTSLSMEFGREGTGVSMDVIAYVKQQATQNPLAKQTGGQEATQGKDWNWVGYQDLIQIQAGVSNAQTPLTFDTGYCVPGGSCPSPWLNDNVLEIPNETATIAIVDALFARVGTASSTFVTIKDDGDHGWVEFGATTYSVSESQANATITIKRMRGVANGRCRVRIISEDRTATALNDYEKYEKDIWFEENSNVTQFNVTLTSDDAFEAPNEYFTLRITDAEVTVNGNSLYLRMEQSTKPTTDVYIIDDGDAGRIGFASSDYIFAETGNNYVTKYQVQLVRTEVVGSIVGDLAVEWLTVPVVPNEATGLNPDRDYVSDSGVVYFYEGINTRNININIQDDDYFEYPNERFLVQITSIKYDAVPMLSDAVFNNQTSVYVMDDGDFGTVDFLLQTIDSTGIRATTENGDSLEWVVYAATELNNAVSPCTLKVGRTGRNVFDTDLRVRYMLRQRTATANVDYTNSTGWIEFIAGVASESTVTIVPQTITEAAGVTVTQGSVTGTLKTALSGSVTSLVIEKAVGITFLTTVDIVVGSTAIVQSSVVSITTVYAQTQSIEIDILHDNVYEYPNEEVEVLLYDLQYRSSILEQWSKEPAETLSTAKLGARAQAIVIISDDGDAGEISFSTTSFSVDESTDKLVTVTVTRTGRSLPNSTVSVRVKSVDNQDIQEIQAIHCAATSGYFNLVMGDMTSKIPATGITALQLEQQLYTDFNVDFNISYADGITSPCTEQGSIMELRYGWEFRGDQSMLQVIPLENDLALTKNELSEIQNVTCYADEGEFQLSWGNDPAQSVTVNAATTTETMLRTSLLTLSAVEDVSVMYSSAFTTWTMTMNSATLTQAIGVEVTQQNYWTMGIVSQRIIENQGVAVSQNEWTISIASQIIAEYVDVSVSQNQWTLSIAAQDITQSAGVAVTQGTSSGFLKTALTGTGMVSVVINAVAGDNFITTADVVIGTGGTATTIMYANINTGTAFKNEYTLTIDSTSLTENAGVAVTQIGGATGTLKTALTGTGMVTVVIEAASGNVFTDAADLTIGTSTPVAASAITAVVHKGISATGTLKTALSGATTSVLISTTANHQFETTVDLIIGGTTVANANINAAANSLSISGSLKTALIGDTTIVDISTLAGVTFVATSDIMIGSTRVILSNINSAVANFATGTLAVALDGTASTTVTITAKVGQLFDITSNLVVGDATVLTADVTAATKSTTTGQSPCSAGGTSILLDFPNWRQRGPQPMIRASVSTSNLWTVAITSQSITESVNVPVSQTVGEWIIVITSQVITESVGVVVSQNEWTFAITSQEITESAGVAVTQGSVSGILKTALTGASTSVVISTVADVVFVATTDLVIGSTTVVLANIASATNSLSGITGTLKTALVGATTNILIQTAPGITFVTTSDLFIGTTTVLLANVNTATSADVILVGTLKTALVGASTNVQVSAASSIIFLTTANLIIGNAEWTLTIATQGVTEGSGVAVTQGTGASMVTGILKTALQNEWTLAIINSITVNEIAGVTVTQGAVTGTLKTTLTGIASAIIIQTNSGATFLNSVDIVIGSTTIAYADINTATNSLTTTSVVILTSAGATFLNSVDIIIGSTTIAHATVTGVTNSKTVNTVALSNVNKVTSLSETLTRQRVYPTFTIVCSADSGRATLNFVFDASRPNYLLTVAATGVDASALQLMMNNVGMDNVAVTYGDEANGNFCSPTGHTTTIVFQDLMYVDQPLIIEANSDSLANRLTLYPIYQEQRIWCKADEGNFILNHAGTAIDVPAMVYTEAQLATAVQTLPNIEGVNVIYSTQNEWTMTITSQDITESAGVAVTQGTGGSMVSGTLATSLTGAGTTSVVLQTAIGVAFQDSVNVVIGSPEWTFALAPPQAITQSSGVSVSQNQWAFGITSQDITQSVGATVTQGTSTGTLKTALTGAGVVNVIINAAAGVTFVTTADVIIGTGGTATTIVHANVNSATYSISASGTLKTTLQNEWIMIIAAQVITNENVGVTVTQGVGAGMVTGTLRTLLQNEWQIDINSQDITENAGVTVTFGETEGSGTLKTALTGTGTISVVIQIPAYIEEIGSANIVIGSTTVVAANVGTATKVGTVIGATTSVVIQALSE